MIYFVDWGCVAVTFKLHHRGFVAVIALAYGGAIASAQEKITFDDHVKPLLNQRCASCHNVSKKSGDLDVTNYTALMSGGGSGESIAAGDPAGSYLFQLVNHDAEPAMPPDSPKIPDEEIGILRAWIEQGALENQASKARTMGPRIAAVESVATERPSTVIVPGHLPQEPVVVPARGNAVFASHTHPWAPLVATAGASQVLLHDTATGELKGVLPFSEGQINVLRFSRNGGILMGAGGRAGAQGVVALWDVASGERLTTLKQESDAILAADISPDHRFVAIGGPQRLVRIYRVQDDKLVHEIKKHTEWVTAIEYSPDGVLLASADRNGGMMVWEAKTAREYLTLAGHPQQVTSLSWRWDSNALGSGSLDGTVKLWEMENGGQIANWAAHSGGVQSVEFTRDGRVATAGRDRTGKLWNQGGQQVVAFGGLTDIGTAVSHCDETDRLLVGDWSGNFVAVGADGLEVARLQLRPQPLSNRLEAIHAELAKLDQEYLPKRTKLDALMQEQTRLETELAAAREKLVVAMAGLTELQGAVQASEQEMARQSEVKATAERNLATLMRQLQVAVAGLESLGAATTRGEDPQWDAVIEGLQGLIEARQTQQAEMQGVVKTSVETLEGLAKKLADDRERIPVMESEIATINGAIASAEQALAPVLAGIEAESPVVSGLETTRQPLVVEAGRLAGEIEFVAKLQGLEQRRLEILRVLEEREVALDAALSAQGLVEAEVIEAANAADALAAQMAERTTQLKTAQVELDALETAQQQAKANAEAAVATKAKLMEGLIALDAGRESAKKASESLPGDTALAEAIAKLDEAAVAKRAELATLEEGLVKLAEEVNRLEQERAARRELLTNWEIELGSLGENRAKVVADRDAKQGRVAELSSAATAARTAVDEMVASLEALRQERAALQGLTL